MKAVSLHYVRTRAALKIALGGCFADNCSVTNLDMLHFAHIKPTKLHGSKRGRAERIEDVLNHPDCYTLLCEDHHSDYDKEETHSWFPKSLLEAANEKGLLLFKMQDVNTVDVVSVKG